MQTKEDLLNDLNQNPLISWRYEGNTLIPTIKATQEEIQAHFDSLPEEERTRLHNIYIKEIEKKFER